MAIKNIINFAFFQIVWFLSVILQNQFYLPVFVTLVAIFLHDRYVVTDRREWIGVFIVVLIGVLADSFFTLIGVLAFYHVSLIPIWLVCIWIVFSMTLCHGLSWLAERYVVAAVLSAFAGPLSYIAGSRLSGGNVALGDPVWLSVVFLSFFWLLMVPFSLFLMNKLMTSKRLMVQGLNL
ncbi:MAG: DUF2878 domain-containing protein [Cellvibrionaceae bacterium]